MKLMVSLSTAENLTNVFLPVIRMLLCRRSLHQYMRKDHPLHGPTPLLLWAKPGQHPRMAVKTMNPIYHKRAHPEVLQVY